MTCENCNEEIMRSEQEECLYCQKQLCPHCSEEHYAECIPREAKEDSELDQMRKENNENSFWNFICYPSGIRSSEHICSVFCRLGNFSILHCNMSFDWINLIFYKLLITGNDES